MARSTSRWVLFAGLGAALASCGGEIDEGRTSAVQFGSTCNQYSVMTYRVWMANLGWGPWACDGDYAGSIGESRQIEAIEVMSLDPRVGVCYQVHAAGIGWMGLTAGTESCDGLLAGTQNQSRRIESIRVRQTGSTLPTGTPPRNLVYQAYVQNRGWVPEAWDWAMSGTTGLSLRMEAMKLFTNNDLPCPSGTSYVLSGGEGLGLSINHSLALPFPDVCFGGQYGYRCGPTAQCSVSLQNFSLFAGVFSFDDVNGGHYSLDVGDHDQILEMYRIPAGSSTSIYAGFSTAGP